MKIIYEIIKSNPLFSGIDYDDFVKIYQCIEGRTTNYKKNDIILLSGDKVNFVGFILSGSVKIIKEDMNGKITILAEASVAESFAEVFACAEILNSPVTVQAAEDSEILFINYKKIIGTCSSICAFHTRLIENMLRLMANKNLILNQKIEILSKRTTREKLILFFDIQRGGNKKFTIPFNREELANALCVDRSAMSNELCRMRDEGLIRFHKNEFEMLG